MRRDGVASVPASDGGHTSQASGCTVAFPDLSQVYGVD